MNQKLSKYLKKGRSESKSAFQKNSKLFFKYCLFLLASFFGKLFFLTYPLFSLADIRIAKTIDETGSFEVEKSFVDANSTNKMWTTIVFIVLKYIILLSGIILLSAVTALLIYVGITIDEMTSFSKSYVSPILGSVGALGLILFIIMTNLYLAPAIYLIQNNENYGIADALSKSTSMMKRKGKMKLLLIEIIHFLRFVLYIAICLGIVIFFERNFLHLVVVFVSIFLGIMLLLTIPKIILSKRIAAISLFADLDKEAEWLALLNNEDAEEIKAKMNKDELLVTLFNHNGSQDDAKNNSYNQNENLQENGEI